MLRNVALRHLLLRLASLLPGQESSQETPLQLAVASAYKPGMVDSRARAECIEVRAAPATRAPLPRPCFLWPKVVLFLNRKPKPRSAPFGADTVKQALCQVAPLSKCYLRCCCPGGPTRTTPTATETPRSLSPRALGTPPSPILFFISIVGGPIGEWARSDLGGFGQ